MFWEYHDILYEKWVGANIGAYQYDNLIQFAENINLDSQQFTECIDQRRYLDRVRADSEFAENNGITSTPTILINGKHVRGNDYQTFQDAIEEALAAAQQP